VVQSDSEEDPVFRQAEQRHLLTVGFLSALRDRLSPEEAFSVARSAFAHYMIAYYSAVLGTTAEGSQERFDVFRRHYEAYAAASDYLYVVESTSTVLAVRYERCPFFDVLSKYGLADFGYAFCLADPVFTEKVLPGVCFRRTHEIVRGAAFCDHTWTFSPVLDGGGEGSISSGQGNFLNE
jgi:hypothetical protein